MTDVRLSVPINTAQYEFREKKSRFLATVSSAESEVEANSFLAEARAINPDATHHCWAHRLRIPPVERSNDDGEPAGTAGVPILQALRGADLTNAIAVVSRWFGGIKLGKGGLARAYGASVREALQKLQVAEIIPKVIFDLELPLSRVGDLKRVIHPPEVEILEETYAKSAHIAISVNLERAAEIEEALWSRQLSPKRRSG